MLLGPIGITGWVLLVATSLTLLVRYKERPGEAANAPKLWPALSALPTVAGVPTLVMLAHPRCPCTRASLAELAKLLGRAPALNAVVVFIRPEGASGSAWEDSDLWDSARAIPGVQARLDPGGVEAKRFGSATSGQVLLYDGQGLLQFQGGITISRGHEGDNPGADRILSLLTTGRAELAQAPVFGCPLNGPTREEAPAP